jgi:hypothetical protein
MSEGKCPDAYEPSKPCNCHTQTASGTGQGYTTTPSITQTFIYNKSCYKSKCDGCQCKGCARARDCENLKCAWCPHMPVYYQYWYSNPQYFPSMPVNPVWCNGGQTGVQ